MFLTGIGDHLGTIALGNHDHRAAVALEEIHIRIHAVSRCRTHRAAGMTFRSLSRTCIEHRVILDVLGQILAAVKQLFHACVGNIASHNNRTRQRNAGRDRVLGQFLADFAHRLVQIDLDRSAFTGFAEFFRNQFAGVGIEFFNPDAVLVDLGFDVAVSRAAHTHADRAACTVAGQTDHANVVSHVFTAELSAQADVLCSFKQRFFEFEVTESTARFVTRGGEVVVEVRRSQLHRQHGLFSRSAADHESDVIGRAGSRTQSLHLFDEVGHECLRIQNGFCFLEEVALVGRTAAFDDAQEVVFTAFNGFNVNLSREIALRVLFFVHRQRSVLRVTQAVGCVGLENA